MADRDRLPDWLLGGRGKRRMLEALVAEPERVWGRSDLMRAAGLDPHDSQSRHVRVLLAAGLLEQDGRKLRLVAGHPLVEPLRAWLAVLGDPAFDVELPPSRGSGGRGGV